MNHAILKLVQDGHNHTTVSMERPIRNALACTLSVRHEETLALLAENPELALVGQERLEAKITKGRRAWNRMLDDKAGAAARMNAPVVFGGRRARMARTPASARPGGIRFVATIWRDPIGGGPWIARLDPDGVTIRIPPGAVDGNRGPSLAHMRALRD